MAVLHLNTDNFNQTVSSGKVMARDSPWIKSIKRDEC